MPSILPALDELGDLLHQGGLVDLVGQLRDHDGRPAAGASPRRRHCGLHHDAAAAVGVHVADGVDLLPLAGDRVAPLVVAEDRARRWGSPGPRTCSHSWSVVRSGSSMSALRGARDLAQVVRRDVGGHAHGDAGRAVDEQVGQLGRQHGRLHARAVVVLDEVDGVLVDVRQQLGGDGGHARLGVAHGGRRVAVDRAEVALAVDERVAQREVLGEAHQRVVQRTGRRAGGTCPSPRRRWRRTCGSWRSSVRPISCIVNRIAAVDGLEAVADVRQRAADDDAHGVVEVRALQLVLDGDGPDAPVRPSVGHARLLCDSGHPAGRRPGRPWRPRRTRRAISPARAGRWAPGAPADAGQRARAAPRRARAAGAVQRVADDPRAMCRRRSPAAQPRLCRRATASTPRGSTRLHSRSAHDERLLDLVVGIAHELADERERRLRRPSSCATRRAARGEGCVASVEPTSRRSMRCGE